MAGIKLEFGFENVQEIAASLARLEDLPTYLKPIIDQWAGEVITNRLAGQGNYPPPPAGSTYQRTGQLGMGWGNPISTGRGEYMFKNDTPYGGYVVGDDQAFMHRGRWWVASQRIEESLVDLAVALDKALSEWPK